MGTLRDGFDEHPTLVTALVLLGLGLSSAIIGIETLAAMFFVVGLCVVVPLVYLLYDPDTESESIVDGGPSAPAAPENEDAPLEYLRKRYARGDLTEEEFERKLDHLLETEKLDDDGSIDQRRREEPVFDRNR